MTRDIPVVPERILNAHDQLVLVGWQEEIADSGEASSSSTRDIQALPCLLSQL